MVFTTRKKSIIFEKVSINETREEVWAYEKGRPERPGPPLGVGRSESTRERDGETLRLLEAY